MNEDVEGSPEVRWDAVVQNSNFWSQPPAPPAAPSSTATEVRVWLFGFLAAANLERPLRLTVPPGATVGSVLAELNGVLGPERFSEVTNPRGKKRNTCRVFVDGEAADDSSAPLVERGFSEIEIILLADIEGG